MIISKAPLRITLGGGGTDLQSYYRRHGGFWISAAVDKYIYISIHEIFPDQIILKYSEMERVKSVDEIKHALLRECLRTMGVKERIEISSFADLPEGTGLGSSGTFTVAVLKGLHSYTHIYAGDGKGSVSGYGAFYDRPQYHIPIGHPTSGRFAALGAQLRYYSGGLVVVNPSSTQRAILSLNAPYRDMFGKSYTTSLTLAPASAIVLLDAGSPRAA